MNPKFTTRLMTKRQGLTASDRILLKKKILHDEPSLKLHNYDALEDPQDNPADETMQALTARASELTGQLKIAIIHDWLTGMRGGESVLEAIVQLFPKAEIFTLIDIPEKVSPLLASLKRHTSWLQKIPGAQKRYRHFLPLMPSMIEQFDLNGFDLIISSSHCVAKGIKKPPGSVHVTYIHAPMRYMWDRYEDYFGPTRASIWVRSAAKLIRKRLQTWDQSVSTPQRIDSLICNSKFIGEQILRHYGRQAQVIYPFADLRRFRQPRIPGRNYLMVTAFAPYKRVDIAIDAFNELKLPLLIVGSGQDEKRLKKRAGPTIDFLGNLSNAAIADLYSKCRALIFPGIEDFGITPVEAMAAGAPVIAFKQGGASETLTSETGIFFETQTAASLANAVKQLENNPELISEAKCRARAQEFSRTRFQTEFIDSVEQTLKESSPDTQVHPMS